MSNQRAGRSRLGFRHGRRTAAVFAVAGSAGLAATLPATVAGATSSTAVSIRQSAAAQRIGRNDLVTATVTSGGAAAPDGTAVTFHPAGGLLADHAYDSIAARPSGGGYWLAAANGAVRSFGNAPVLPGTSTDPFADPVTDIESNPTGDGFWLLTANGRVIPRGHATSQGDPSQILQAPAVSMGADPNGGYWILTMDGNVYSYGVAHVYGTALSNVSAAANSGAFTFATALVPTTTGNGYWIVLSDGTILPEGDADPSFTSFPGVDPSSGDLVLRAVATPSGQGLIGLTEQGSTVTVGTAPATTQVTDDNSYEVGLAADSTGSGYWVMGADGQVYPEGDAGFLGDPWTVATSHGSAALAVTGSYPDVTNISASAGGVTSPTLNTTWSFAPAYWQAAGDGGVFTFGEARFFGSMGGKRLNQPIVGMAPTPDGGGYWLVARDGGVFAFGDAPFYGSAAKLRLRSPIVAIVASPDGGGYWLVGADGGVFSFGDAPFAGSLAGKHLNRPIVGMAPTSYGDGYWLVGGDGGVFAFGDAGFFGSAGGLHLAAPVVGMADTPDDGGYWLAGADGGVFALGDAGFHGSAGRLHLSAPVVSMAPTIDGEGYWLSGADGGIFSFGDAGFAGSTAGLRLTSPIVSMASDPAVFEDLFAVEARSAGSAGQSGRSLGRRLPAVLAPQTAMSRHSLRGS